MTGAAAGPRLRPNARPRVARPRMNGALLMVGFVMIAPLASVLLSESALPFNTRLTGWILWVLCFFPAWDYLRKRPERRPPIPFMPVIGLLFALYYARSLVFGTYNEHWRIRLDPASDYAFPALVALQGWSMLLVGWLLVRPRLKKIATTEYDATRIRSIALGLACLAPIAHVAQFYLTVPILVGGIARFLQSLGYLGLGLSMMLVAGPRPALITKVGLIVIATTLVALQLASGFISGFLVTAAVLFFSYWAVRKHLSFPLVLAAVFVALAALMVKSTLDEYRKVAWRGAVALSADAQLSVLGTLMAARIEREGVLGAISSGTRSSAKRSANMDLLADIVRRTPSPVPYWNGASYVSLVGLAIPRFLWPDKPTKGLGQEFGHRYTLLDAHDTGTSFNFPFLVEFYANFGELGVFVGMLIVGVIYGTLARIANRPGQDALMTMAGIVLMLPLLNIESDFSLTFGGLVMDGVALWLVLRVIRRHSTHERSMSAGVVPTGQRGLLLGGARARIARESGKL